VRDGMVVNPVPWTDKTMAPPVATAGGKPDQE